MTVVRLLATIGLIQPARTCGPAAGRVHPRNASRPGAQLDGGTIGQNRSALALGLLPALHARGRPTADGIPARLADGPRQGSAESPTHGHGAVAERVGYSSANTFSTAFARYVGRPPKAYARERMQIDRKPLDLRFGGKPAAILWFRAGALVDVRSWPEADFDGTIATDREPTLIGSTVRRR